MSDLFSLGRMAARLGVTQEWLREQAESGRIPCLVAGRRWLFNPAAVIEALSVQAGRTRLRRRGAGLQDAPAGSESTIASEVDSEAVQGESKFLTSARGDDKGA